MFTQNSAQAISEVSSEVSVYTRPFALLNENDRQTQSTVDSILQLLLKHANFLNTSSTESMELNPIHQEKIRAAVVDGLPLQLVIPAFPAKSPNRDKTMGHRPDMGEILALQFLNKLCEKIATIHQPGAEVIICSDGRVFSDLVLVSDNEVTQYREDIKTMIAEFKLENLRTFNLEDVFQTKSFDQMRDELTVNHGRSLETLRDSVKSSLEAKALFNGIHRFIIEDQSSLDPALSRNQVSKRCKQTAYQVIQRSNAWSDLVEKYFPQAVRLSIHPQPKSSKKLGVKLVRSGDQWRTPWHSVALYDGRNYMLVPHKVAVDLGAQPEFFKNKYGFYDLSKSPSESVNL